MRKLVVTENITLDGVIDTSEGWFAPAGDGDVDQSDLNESLREQAAAADALLVGRVSRLVGEGGSCHLLMLFLRFEVGGLAQAARRFV